MQQVVRPSLLAIHYQDRAWAIRRTRSVISFGRTQGSVLRRQLLKEQGALDLAEAVPTPVGESAAIVRGSSQWSGH